MNHHTCWLASFILHPSAFILSYWPDSGLTRNTRSRCYRCSVPGLAGFTRRALCGARSLITQVIFNCRLSIAHLLSDRVALHYSTLTRSESEIGNWQWIRPPSFDARTCATNR